MTPASVIRGVLAVAGMVAPLIPSWPAASIIGDVVDALAPLPDLVDELGDGEWTDDDVTALRDALVVALEGAPGIPGWHARRIAGGVAAVTALTRACDVVVPDPPGEVVQLLPVRFDAGARE